MNCQFSNCERQASPDSSRCDQHPFPSGRKDDKGKLRWDLMPWGPLRYVVKVLEFGADLYGVDNWQIVPQSRVRYFSAAMRHILAWFQGEKLDPISGLPHLAHAITCFLFLIWKDDHP